MTPREQADEILAANTAESLPYAILAAAGKAMEAKSNDRAAYRHWTAVHAILRLAAGGRVNIHRVQS